MSIKDNTNSVLAEVNRRIKTKLTKAALLVERTAKQMVPVKTGTLKRSITHEIKARSAVVGTNVEYAPHVEMGTSKMPAKPFLRPALESNMEKIRRIFTENE